MADPEITILGSNNLNDVRPVKKFWRFRLGWLIAGLMFALVIATFLLLRDSDRIVLWRTMWLALSAATIAIPVAVLAAVCVIQGRFAGKFLLLILIGLAFVPPYVNVSCWDSAFGKLGWLTSAQGQILQPLLSGWSAAVWVHAVGFVPPFALLFSFAMFTGRTFEEQAKLELRRSVIFLHITLRRLLPLMLICLLWALIVCSREIAVTDLYQIGTLAEQIYLGYSLGQVNSLATNWSAEAIAAAGTIGTRVRVVQFFIVLAMSIIFFSSLTNFSKESSSSLKGFDDRYPTRLDWTMLVGCLVLVMLLAALPITNLIFQAGNAVQIVDGQPEQSWTFANLVDSVTKAASDFRSAFFWSGLMAMVSSSLIVIVSSLLCFVAKTDWKAWCVLIFLTASCAAISGPDIGSYLTNFFTRSQNTMVLWFYNYTIGPAVIANMIFCWPMVTLIIWFAISQTTSDQIENASLEQVGLLHRVIEFGVRQHWRTYVGIWMLAVALCFSELSASQMVLPPGIETVAQVTLGKLHAGVNETTAALSLLTIGLVVAITLPAWIIVKQASRYQRLA